jgi:hypothetical protein
MIHRASRLRRVEDVAAVVVPWILLLTHPSSTWFRLLTFASMFVVAWSVFTLHYPREVEVDEAGVHFRGYGREHSYAWNDCVLRVKKFLVKDRVLVTVVQLTPRRTRSYWLVGNLSEFPALVKGLEERMRAI